ncbi:MAG: hypothetical protein LAT75_07700 [Candidatus Cyclonatronum sp.]|uniref:hypothetical protein n=1 Tax=Cyclonatronum sp. TaxID=3024185 RepID=UPI0025BF4EA1|nr:hypothetical protein [Cyclonatronum sp.]MCH8486735.1 hypothetical protein [Cyclonatronum sp.]
MKRTIILSVATAVLVLFAGFADLSAQQRGQSAQSGNRGADIHTMALIYGNEINLTEQQQAEIARIRVDFRRDMQQQRSEFAGRQNRRAQADNRAAMAERRTDMRTRIEAVLTPAQLEQIAQIRSERMDNRQAQQDLMRTAYIEAVAEDMGLDDAKTRQLVEIHANFREEMAPVREAMQNAMRTQAEMSETRQQRQRLQVHREQLNEQIREVLSEEEFAQWTEEWNQLMPQNRQNMQGRVDRQQRPDAPAERNRRNNR